MNCVICDEVFSPKELSICSCGNLVCKGCEDPIYSDETCCKDCGADIRKNWRDCKGHEWDVPYENDNDEMMAECKICSFPTLVQLQQPTTLTPATPDCGVSPEPDAARKD